MSHRLKNEFFLKKDLTFCEKLFLIDAWQKINTFFGIK
jgi:hypothetical protein